MLSYEQWSLAQREKHGAMTPAELEGCLGDDPHLVCEGCSSYDDQICVKAHKLREVPLLEGMNNAAHVRKYRGSKIAPCADWTPGETEMESRTGAYFAEGVAYV